ncbi:MAG: hypothetical protein IKL10_00940 [Clostridia bacterium]|nr:hypothetical protein [Clostridia bacterium]
MNCPKCGTPIGRFDLSPNCKKCGVHIMYYTQEEDLSRDAKKTELEFTTARIFVAKIKAAYISGKIPIARMIFLLLSIASLILPLYNIKLSFPWWEYEISVGALGIYNIVSDSFWQIFGALSDVGVAKSLYVIMLCSFVLLILAALMTALCLLMWLLSFINIKKTAKITVGFATFGILSQLAGTVLSFISMNLSGSFEFISSKPLFGGIVSILMLGIFLATNIILAVNEPEIPIKEADRKRLEIKEKLKKGEITLDDLPLPIIEEEKTDDMTSTKKRGKKK